MMRENQRHGASSVCLGVRVPVVCDVREAFCRDGASRLWADEGRPPENHHCPPTEKQKD